MVSKTSGFLEITAGVSEMLFSSSMADKQLSMFYNGHKKTSSIQRLFSHQQPACHSVSVHSVAQLTCLSRWCASIFSTSTVHCAWHDTGNDDSAPDQYGTVAALNSSHKHVFQTQKSRTFKTNAICR